MLFYLAFPALCGKRSNEVDEYPTVLEPEDLHCPLGATVVQSRGGGAKLRLEKLEEDSWRIFKCSGISLRLVNISPSDKLSVASHKIIEIWHMLVS